MAVSVFDLFKVGIGPSSSHTVGPMRAARTFVEGLAKRRALHNVARVTCELYGSLGATGKGHGSGGAVLLGLAGFMPDSVDPDAIPEILESMRSSGKINLFGSAAIDFSEKKDVVFFGRRALPLHPNGLTFTALGRDGTLIESRTFYSIGGGFIVGELVGTDGTRRLAILSDATVLPHQFHSGNDLLSLAKSENCSIAEIMRRNERTWRANNQIDEGLLQIWKVMQDCVRRGCETDGTLPGGLQVRRRAASLHGRLVERAGTTAARDPLAVLDWVNLFALAVNEENAAGGRVVTAPTNGAAGIIPAVLHYYTRFVPGATEEGVIDFFLTAGAIGILGKSEQVHRSCRRTLNAAKERGDESDQLCGCGVRGQEEEDPA